MEHSLEVVVAQKITDTIRASVLGENQAPHDLLATNLSARDDQGEGGNGRGGNATRDMKMWSRDGMFGMRWQIERTQ